MYSNRLGIISRSLVPIFPNIRISIKDSMYSIYSVGKLNVLLEC